MLLLDGDRQNVPRKEGKKRLLTADFLSTTVTDVSDLPSRSSLKKHRARTARRDASHIAEQHLLRTSGLGRWRAATTARRRAQGQTRVATLHWAKNLSVKVGQVHRERVFCVRHCCLLVSGTLHSETNSEYYKFVVPHNAATLGVSEFCLHELARKMLRIIILSYCKVKLMFAGELPYILHEMYQTCLTCQMRSYADIFVDGCII